MTYIYYNSNFEKLILQSSWNLDVDRRKGQIGISKIREKHSHFPELIPSPQRTIHFLKGGNEKTTNENRVGFYHRSISRPEIVGKDKFSDLSDILQTQVVNNSSIYNEILYVDSKKTSSIPQGTFYFKHNPKEKIINFSLFGENNKKNIVDKIPSVLRKNRKLGKLGEDDEEIKYVMKTMFEFIINSNLQV